jgi:hypothetical protein
MVLYNQNSRRERTMQDINLLTGLYEEPLTFPFCLIEQRWRKFEKDYIEPVREIKEHLCAILNTKDGDISETARHHFSAGLSECKKDWGGLRISICDRGEGELFFDNLKRKIFKIKNDKKEEFMNYSSIKYCKLTYKPCLMQSIKVRFSIDLIFIGRNNKVLLKLSTTESCYDDDRRPYEVQLRPFVKTCRTIAAAGRWVFRENCSTTF